MLDGARAQTMICALVRAYSFVCILIIAVEIIDGNGRFSVTSWVLKKRVTAGGRLSPVKLLTNDNLITGKMHNFI